MKITNVLSNIVFAAFLFLEIAPSSYAAEYDRISSLEKSIAELKERITILEKISRGKPQQNSVASTEELNIIANWRSLKSGMSYDEVRAILGEPQRIDGGDVAFWTYSNRGRVTFMNDRLHSWSEPR